MYLVGVGAASTLSTPFGCGARRGGTFIQRYYKGLLGLVDMHMYGLVAAEDGEPPSGHMWRRMSSLSVAVRGDCLEFVPRRPVRTKSQ
jgi:hypothetical protein